MEKIKSLSKMFGLCFVTVIPAIAVMLMLTFSMMMRWPRATSLTIFALIFAGAVYYAVLSIKEFKSKRTGSALLNSFLSVYFFYLDYKIIEESWNSAIHNQVPEILSKTTMFSFVSNTLVAIIAGMFVSGVAYSTVLLFMEKRSQKITKQ